MAILNMKKNPLKLLVLLPLLLLLTSCSTGKRIVDLKLKYITAESAPVVTTDRIAEAQIAEAATAVGHSLQELSAMQMSLHPHTKLKKPFSAKAIGMGHLASINWTGPAKLLIKKIAQASHYRLRTIGKTPAIPAIVYLNVHNQPLAAILRDVTYQIINKATVMVYPKSRLIELRYHSS